MLFDIVVAGEVYPQPQLLLFCNATKTLFYWWDPLPTMAQPQVCNSRIKATIHLRGGIRCKYNNYSNSKINYFKVKR